MPPRGNPLLQRRERTRARTHQRNCRTVECEGAGGHSSESRRGCKDAQIHLSAGKPEQVWHRARPRAGCLRSMRPNLPISTCRVSKPISARKFSNRSRSPRHAAKLVPLVESLRDQYGIGFFSIGGGVGIVYDPALESGNPRMVELLRSSANGSPRRTSGGDRFRSLKPLGMRILFEPGRFMVGNAGVLLSHRSVRQEDARRRPSP